MKAIVFSLINFCLWLLIFSCKQEPDPALPETGGNLTIGKPIVIGVAGASVSIDSVNAIYNITVPKGTSLKALRLSIPITSGSTISPDPGVAQDYTNPVTFTITSKGGKKKVITIKITVRLTAPSSDDRITGFSFKSFTPEVRSIINHDTYQINAILPAGADLTRQTPTITLWEGATVSPASGVSQDFSKPVKYTVTAENGDTQAYEVKVDKFVNATPNSDIVLINELALDANTGKAFWKMEAGDRPLAVNNKSVYTDDFRNFYALDLYSGKQKWKFIFPTNFLVRSATAGDGVVFAMGTSGGGVEEVARIYALDEASGTLKWEYAVKRTTDYSTVILYGAVVHDGMLYVPIGNKMFGFATKSGEKKLEIARPSMLTNEENFRPFISSNPCIADKSLVFLGAYSVLHIMNLSNSVIKTIPLSIGMTGDPTFANGKIYLRGTSAVISLKPEDFPPYKGYKFEANEVYNGIFPNPFVASGTVFVGGSRKLLALDAFSFTKKWEYLSDSYVSSGTVAANGTVFFGNENGTFFALDADTGTKKWEVVVSDYDLGSSIVATKDGKVYHTSGSGMQE